MSYIITKQKMVIPSSCKICYTLFTRIGVIGNMNNHNKETSRHVDKEDYLTVWFPKG